MERGSDPPKMIANAPELTVTDEFFFTAYKRLKSEGGYSGEIPWSSIIRYGTHYDLCDDELEEFVTIIELISRAHDDHDKETKTNVNSSKTKPGNRLGAHLQK